MLKQVGVVGVMTAVGALAVSSVAPATGTGYRAAPDDRRIVIRVLSTSTQESFVDNGKKGFSQGDAFVFTSRLTKNGKRVGHTGVVCTITSVKREESECVGTARLRNRGQIAIQGLTAGERRVFSFPITGGTGDFEEAGGTLWVRDLSNGRERLTFRLIR